MSAVRGTVTLRVIDVREWAFAKLGLPFGLEAEPAVPSAICAFGTGPRGAMLSLEFPLISVPVAHNRGIDMVNCAFRFNSVHC